MLKEGMILAERYEIISKVGTGGWRMFTKPGTIS